MNSYNWYQNLIKPSWAPPSNIFGIVWPILYIIIFISFGFVFYKVFSGKIPFIVALPFILNLIFNLIYSPVQFGLKNNYLASIVILLVLVTLIWALVANWNYEKWVAIINIPYLIWVSFASILQLSITYLNR